MFWLFATISLVAGTSFYILLGAVALEPFIKRLRRLGRQCKVGDFDEDGNLITRHDCWF
jgi:hypothetical protein